MSSLLFDSNALVYWIYPSAPQHAEVSHLISRAVEEDGRIYACHPVDFITTYGKKAFAGSFAPKPTAAQALSLTDAT